MKLTKYSLYLVCFLSLPFLTGGLWSVNSATEEEELILVNTEREVRMGKKLHKNIQEKFDLPVDPLVQERIREIGKTLAEHSDRKNVVYHFTVLNYEKDDMYNAFAAPGGYIYIFDDLVKALKTDEKIAAVLAHEMGHVEALHSIKRWQGSWGATALMFLGSQLPKEPGTYAKMNEAIGQLMCSYSRHDERQADKLSVKYMRKGGYNPKGAVGAIKTLTYLRKKGARMKARDYKTHPYLSERIAYINNLINGHTNFNSYINLVAEEDGLEYFMDHKAPVEKVREKEKKSF